MIKQHWLKITAVVLGLGLISIYALPILTIPQRAFFANNLADGVLLLLMVAMIVYRKSHESDQVSRLFWAILLTAFLLWFTLAVLYNLVWSFFSQSTQSLLNAIGYFLFYAMMIAAIEIRSFQDAKQLLTQHSLLIWISTLSFTLGGFIYLVLIPSATQVNNSPLGSNAFLFYMIMDSYLVLRWWHLAFKCRLAHWKGYFLLGVAMLNWLVADTVEFLNFAGELTIKSGGLIDWMWYTPYLFLFFGLLQPFSSIEKASSLKGFSRMHLLNSPVLFLPVILLLHQFTQNNAWLPRLQDPTQHSMYIGWLAVTLLLAVLQFLLLITQRRKLRFQLKESQFRDESLQQQLQQKARRLQQQTDSYRSILETTSNAIFTVASDGIIHSSNPAATRMLGYSADDFIGMNFSTLVQQGDELALVFKYQSYRQKLKRHANGLELEATMLTKHDKPLAVHATVSEGQTGNEAPLVISLADIREQKQAEQEVHRLKDQFTANISHEFRTPLTIINGVLDNLASSIKEPQDLQQLQTAKTNGLRMIRMVEQLLELSRSTQETFPITPINAGLICHFVCQSFQSIATEKSIQFEYPEQQDCWVHGNPQALEKVLFNLLSNAFKYTPFEGSISVNYAVHNRRLTLSVKDSGSGISEAEQAKVFHRFYRAEGTDGKQIHGVGIGLALVKELCQRMGWQIQLQSEPNQGSTFSVEMPVTEQPATVEVDHSIYQVTDSLSHNLEAELVDAQAVKIKQQGSKSRYLVLVIEDNSDMQSHLTHILSPHHQCLIASNGDEGIRMALDYVPDIIISDVMMPGMNGFEALKILRRNELTAHIPVIMLTARVDTDSKIEGLEAEADDYLTKPFDARELLLRINNQIQSRLKLQQKLTRQWHFSMAKPETEKPSVEDKFLIKLNEVFLSHYSDPDVPMSFVASELAMSERQLQRKVKALLGVSPLEAMRQFRLEKAKELLKAQNQVGVSAQACGFSSQSHFGRCFKEYVGMSPREFQKKHQAAKPKVP